MEIVYKERKPNITATIRQLEVGESIVIKGVKITIARTTASLVAKKDGTKYSVAELINGARFTRTL